MLIYFVKGLEFDVVVVYDVFVINYFDVDLVGILYMIVL